MGPSIYEDILAEVEAAIMLHSPATIIIAGDWNAHPLSPRDAFDRRFRSMTQAMEALGFSVRPRSEHPPTFRSGPNTSTIDFAFVLGAPFTLEVGKIFIAQHRPLVGVLEIPTHGPLPVSASIPLFLLPISC